MITYNGREYTRRNGKWTDSDCIIVHGELQRTLNKEVAKNIDPSVLSLRGCVKEGDDFKNSGSIAIALMFYEEALKRGDFKTAAYILPRMTSCYRKNGNPQKAIEVLTYASGKFGKNIVTPALLISVAAAYCDVGDYARAKKCCDRAYAQSNGKGGEELRLVYERIKKETK